MKASEIYFKTMKFVWMKFGLGLLFAIISIIIMCLSIFLGSLFGEFGMMMFLIIGIAGVGVANSIINSWMGYLVKAGHVAIITEAVTTGEIPENQFEVAKNMVISRFGASNVYFVVDRLVSGAVKQLQRAMEKIGNVFSNIPGVSNAMQVVNLFIGIVLGYVDECCLGYVFHKKEEGAFKSSMDGVVIYFQNYKKILKDAAITTVTVLLTSFAIWLVFFIAFGMLFKIMDISGIIAFIVAVFLTIPIEKAFVNSWILVKMMVSYMEVAPSTEITFDLYGKLCGLSSKFKELFNKAKEETPELAGVVPQAAATGVPGGFGMNFINNIQQPQYQAPQQQTTQVRYCANCGTQLQGNGQFCSNCGSSVEVRI